MDVDLLKEHISSRLPVRPRRRLPRLRHRRVPRPQPRGGPHRGDVPPSRLWQARFRWLPVPAARWATPLAAAKVAEEAGADALLVLPPYLVTGPTDGLVAYIEAVADASSLPVIVYHRGNAKFTAASMAAPGRQPQGGRLQGRTGRRGPGPGDRLGRQRHRPQGLRASSTAC